MTATNPTPTLAIVGSDGKMGRAVASLAPERGWRVVAQMDAEHNTGGKGITRDSLKGADVAIEFTTPKAAADNVRASVAAGCPIVVGTTGWYDALPALSAWVEQQGGALLTAPNFSLGVNVFEQIVERASELLRGMPGFDAHLVETHHSAKKDAPSGTALKLAGAAAKKLGREVPTTSIRTGSVPGTHQLVFDAPFEQIRLEHEARDRRVFAEGALVAAAWLIGRRGVFTMRDVLASPTSSARVP
jgi:4-hydroxy-tetrahydrodipicolinate reductase